MRRTAAFATSTPLVRFSTPESVIHQVERKRQWMATMAPTRKTLRKRKLGSSDLVVTEACLGTMTWGTFNTEAEAHAQLDYAMKERGVNFLDTAELYPVPPSAPGYAPGRTEEYIGSWVAKNRALRKELIIATKVQGYVKSSSVAGNRTVPPTGPLPDGRLDGASIQAACEGSLRRLQTDYVDLYQLHWPDRYVPIMGGRIYDPKLVRPSVSFRDTLLGIKALLDSGKIRAYGVSNETTFGVCEIVRTADELRMPRPATIQNQFCLLNRTFEGELAEACAPHHYNIGLLPWSVLGGGALTGKYRRADEMSDASRFRRFKQFQKRFHSERNLDVIERYRKIGDDAGISLATLAIAFVNSRWYVPSTILGSTSIAHLEENINALGVKLSDSVLRKIDSVHDSMKDPYIMGYPTGSWDPR